MTLSYRRSNDELIIGFFLLSLVFMIPGCGSSEAVDPTLKVEKGAEPKDSVSASGRIRKGVQAKVPQPEKRGTGASSRE